jgi:hypothetical protein
LVRSSAFRRLFAHSLVLEPPEGGTTNSQRVPSSTMILSCQTARDISTLYGMLTLINTNRMRPPIAPIGLDYVAGAAGRSGIDVDLLDLNLADNPQAAVSSPFSRRQPN